MPVQLLSHIGICVSDLEASIRLYCDGLGFREIHRLKVAGKAAEQLLQLEDLALTAVYLERDGVRIELLHYPSPGHVGEATPRPMNALGLTHLSLRVDDLEGTLGALRAAGAVVLEPTQMFNPEYGAGAAFVTDPDGTRIELVQAPGDPAGLPGA